jgi:hypothetical protein
MFTVDKMSFANVFRYPSSKQSSFPQISNFYTLNGSVFFFIAYLLSLVECIKSNDENRASLSLDKRLT